MKHYIQLYADHGISEPFHSEFKTDMDIERLRLPSDKFATNTRALACSVTTDNILRWIGQNGLTGSRSPRCHKAKHRRIEKVMQDMMNIAAWVIKTARRIKQGFGKGCRSFRRGGFYIRPNTHTEQGRNGFCPYR